MKDKALKITANMVTVLRIVLMPIPGYLLYGGEDALFAAFAMTILLGLTDLLDGIMARREGTSVLGGLLDPIADKIFIAVIYLPLTDRGIIPVWLTAAMFARDFTVTALRSALSYRDAPMRTAKLAKYKTAIQMAGIEYVILFMANKSRPDHILVWIFLSVPILMSLGLMVYRAFTGRKQGPRSITMLALTTLCFVLRWWFGPAITSIVIIYVIGALTIISGFSYFVDAWSALVGKRGSGADIFRFVFDGILLPALFVPLFIYYNNAFASTAIILIVTLELAVGGLQNLLASEKVTIPFGRSATKSVVQIGLAAGATVVAWGAAPSAVGSAMLGAALGLTTVYAAVMFIAFRKVYLAAI